MRQVGVSERFDHAVQTYVPGWAGGLVALAVDGVRGGRARRPRHAALAPRAPRPARRRAGRRRRGRARRGDAVASARAGERPTIWRSSTIPSTSRRSRRSATPAAASSTPTRRSRPGRGPRPGAARAPCCGRSTPCANGECDVAVRRRPAARPSRRARSGDGLLPVQQRRRSAPPSWPPPASAWRSSTGTCTTATARRTCSTTTRACCTCRPTSRRSTPAPGCCARPGPATAPGRNAQPAVPGRHRRRHVPRRVRHGRDAGGRALRARLADHLGRLRRPPQRPARRAAAHQRRLRRHGDAAARALVPERRVLVVLEGGYDLEALTYGVGATLSALRRRVVPAGAGVDRRDRAAHGHRRPAALGAVSVRRSAATGSSGAPTVTCGGACTAPPAWCSSCASPTGRG